MLTLLRNSKDYIVINPLFLEIFEIGTDQSEESLTAKIYLGEYTLKYELKSSNDISELQKTMDSLLEIDYQEINFLMKLTDLENENNFKIKYNSLKLNEKNTCSNLILNIKNIICVFNNEEENILVVKKCNQITEIKIKENPKDVYNIYLNTLLEKNKSLTEELANKNKQEVLKNKIKNNL